ncbi:hypothetical protein SLE2022_027350 [Rubroshorea leprosula]|uniref:Uncharacterized protein n=1 Tax=Rubroshorea leprosula TaxID=152421 RepID=A0AAV5JLT9_9ROSI|nr:hypothetical protein SLEP1_g24115 [Rubroshorea leprosula]
MDNNITMADAPQPQQSVALLELVAALEHATLMAKQLPATADQTHLFQIYSSLQVAHHHLSFLSNAQFPTLSHQLPPAPENSLSSATGAANDRGGEPMQVGDENDAEAEENSKTSIDRVEERMRECFIKNKRAKRPLSPSSATVAEERRVGEDGHLRAVKGFDPHGDTLRALDLIYQFHG